MKINRVSPADTLFFLFFVFILSACTAASPVSQPVTNQTPPQLIAALAHTAAPTPTMISAQLLAEADAAQQVLINVYQRIDPAVVNIEISTTDNGQVDA